MAIAYRTGGMNSATGVGLDRRTVNQMKVDRDPRGVVDHRVHRVAHIDDSAETTRPEKNQGDARDRNCSGAHASQSGSYFCGVRGARQRPPSAGMIAPPILARLASGSGARSARGFRERKQAFRKRPNASSLARKLKWRERPLARTTIRVTSSAERFSGKRWAIS